jgi:hypothetical protein
VRATLGRGAAILSDGVFRNFARSLQSADLVLATRRRYYRRPRPVRCVDRGQPRRSRSTCVRLRPSIWPIIASVVKISKHAEGSQSSMTGPSFFFPIQGTLRVQRKASIRKKPDMGGGTLLSIFVSGIVASEKRPVQ